MTKYTSEEERLQARRECQRRYMAEKRIKRRQEKIEKGLPTTETPGRPRLYATDEERLDAKRKQIAASVLRLYYKRKEEKEKDKETEKIEVSE